MVHTFSSYFLLCVFVGNGRILFFRYSFFFRILEYPYMGWAEYQPIIVIQVRFSIYRGSIYQYSAFFCEWPYFDDIFRSIKFQNRMLIVDSRLDIWFKIVIKYFKQHLQLVLIKFKIS